MTRHTSAQLFSPRSGHTHLAFEPASKKTTTTTTTDQPTNQTTKPPQQQPNYQTITTTTPPSGDSNLSSPQLARVQARNTGKIRGTASKCWRPGQHFLSLKPTTRSVAGCAGHLSAVVGVVPLHARTCEEMEEGAQENEGVRSTLTWKKWTALTTEAVHTLYSTSQTGCAASTGAPASPKNRNGLLFGLLFRSVYIAKMRIFSKFQATSFLHLRHGRQRK